MAALALAIAGAGSPAPAPAERPRNASLPAVSPDGRRIAFVAGRGDSVWQVYVVKADGGGTLRLTPHEEPRLDETPSWFPDGRRLAFQSDRTGRMEIWTVNADGTHPRQVTR